MHRTIFNTPVFKHALRAFSSFLLFITGWKTSGVTPDFSKYVMVAAPHTSNWDFPVTMAIASKMNIEIYWMGKEKLFRWPFGPFFRWFGGISIDRSKTNNMVQSTIDAFNRAKSLVVVIQPEGTRSKVNKWKSGFYHIAMGANVPIVLGFIDFKRKVGGLMGHVVPSGDYEKDLKEIQKNYVGISGRYSEKF